MKGCDVVLSSEEIGLLRWIDSRSEPVSLPAMSDLEAPGYTDERVEALRWNDYLSRGIGFYDGASVGVYSLSDKARAELEQLSQQEAERAKQEAEKQAAEAKRLEERAADRADAERRYRGQNRVTIIAALLGAAVGFALGVIAEHFTGVVSFVAGIH